MNVRVVTLVNAYAKEPGQRTLQINLNAISKPRWISSMVRGYDHALSIFTAEHGTVVVVGTQDMLIRIHTHCLQNAEVAARFKLTHKANGEAHEPA